MRVQAIQLAEYGRNIALPVIATRVPQIDQNIPIVSAIVSPTAGTIYFYKCKIHIFTLFLSVDRPITPIIPGVPQWRIEDLLDSDSDTVNNATLPDRTIINHDLFDPEGWVDLLDFSERNSPLDHYIKNRIDDQLALTSEPFNALGNNFVLSHEEIFDSRRVSTRESRQESTYYSTDYGAYDSVSDDEDPYKVHPKIRVRLPPQKGIKSKYWYARFLKLLICRRLDNLHNNNAFLH